MNIALFDQDVDSLTYLKSVLYNKGRIFWMTFTGLDSDSKRALKENSISAIVTSEKTATGTYEEIIRYAGNCKKNLNTPIFLLSADCSYQSIEKAYLAGVNEIVPGLGLSDGNMAKTFLYLLSLVSSVEGAKVLFVGGEAATTETNYSACFLKQLGFSLLQVASFEDLLDEDEGNCEFELIIADTDIRELAIQSRFIDGFRKNESFLKKTPMILLSEELISHQNLLVSLEIDEYIFKPTSPYKLYLSAVEHIHTFRTYRNYDGLTV